MIYRIIKYGFLFFVLALTISCAQDQIRDENELICESKFEFADSANLAELPIYSIVTEIAKSFIGMEYEAKTLDQSIEENLVIHLSGLDCYTFLESSLAIARCIKAGKATFKNYKDEILNLRYRNGELNGYASRLHYFSDWIYDTGKRGITKDITKEIGGIFYDNNVNFMSTHPDAYIQLKDNPKLVKEIEAIEKRISVREYYYIPQNKISALEAGIISGDILGITTGIKGLDIAHTGIAIRMNDGRIHLLHAPNVGKKIQISEEPLADYIAKHKSQTGIMVVRPVNP